MNAKMDLNTKQQEALKKLIAEKDTLEGGWVVILLGYNRNTLAALKERGYIEWGTKSYFGHEADDKTIARPTTMGWKFAESQGWTAKVCRHLKGISWDGDHWRCQTCGEIVDYPELETPAFSVGDKVHVRSHRPDFDGQRGVIVNREWRRYGGDTMNYFYYDVRSESGKPMCGFRKENLVLSSTSPELLA